MPKKILTHDEVTARSYANLENARQKAAKTTDYNSEVTRQRLSDETQERFGARPHMWQLDATEAILLGLDSIVVSATGTGKTLLFMMPLFLDKKKKVIIILPLKILH